MFQWKQIILEIGDTSLNTACNIVIGHDNGDVTYIYCKSDNISVAGVLPYRSLQKYIYKFKRCYFQEKKLQAYCLYVMMAPKHEYETT